MTNNSDEKEYRTQEDDVRRNFRERKAYKHTSRISNGGINNRKKTFSSFLVKVAVAVIVFFVISLVKGSDNLLAKEISHRVIKIINWDYDTGKLKNEIEKRLGKSIGNNKASEYKTNDANTTSVKTVDNNMNNLYTFDAGEDMKLDYSEETEPVETPEEKTSEDSTLADDIGFIIPVKGKIGSKFGDRVHPIKKIVDFHYGVDIEANSGVPIKASMDGEVSQAGFEKTLGNYVKLKHKDGFVTNYFHCSVLKCKTGQKINKGDIIALVGNTGTSQGPHLHFEIWKSGKALNPEVYLKGK